MSKSYDRNIERLKTNQASVSQQEQTTAIQAGQYEGQRKVQNAQAWQKLTPFSTELQAWKKRDIEKEKLIGLADARRSKKDQADKLSEYGKQIQTIEDARKTGELAFEFEDAKAQDTAYHQIKAEMLKMSGPNGYPEADRIAQLSPWAQVGYAQEKLRVFNESFDDKLAHAMQNSTEEITLGGITFTPAEIHNNPLALPMKEAAMEHLAEKIRQNGQVDKWSPEMLKLSKTEDAIQKAKDSQMGKYRERYNLDSSMRTRQKAELEWSRSEKTGYDLHRLLLINGATVDDKGNLLGNAGGWDQVMEILKKEGVATHSPQYADKIGSYEIPESLRLQIGAKKGTTYAQQWPDRFSKLKRDIKQGYVKEVNDEEKFINAAGTDLTNEFKTKARGGALSTQEVNEYKRKFGQLGLPIPGDVTNYETATMRDEREDKQEIEYLMASQDGYISNEQLDRFHPKAALEFREKASKMEEKALKAHDSEAKIKAHMDTTFTNMGIKANEKSPAYVEAMSNAKADYAEKYNRYVAMGYDSAEASRLALHAKEVKDPETGEVIGDSMGVLAEIEQFGENSKYVVEGQAIEKSIKPGHLRVARVASGKREMLDDPDIIFNGTIGGDYGHRQLTSVKNNIDKYGARKGLRMDKGAMQYYKGLARGRDDNWMGLLDKQLKATGHPGLWEEERPAAVDLLSAENGKGEKLDDPNNLVGLTKSANQAFNYPSVNSYLYGMFQLKEGENYGKSVWSTWDLPEHLDTWGLPQTGGWHLPEPTYEEYLEMERKGRWPRDKTPPKRPNYDPTLPNFPPIGGKRI